MEFLFQRNNDKSKSIERSPFQDVAAALRNLSEAENSTEVCQRKESGQASKGHGRPMPEPATEHFPPRQPIGGNTSCLDSCHDPTCQEDDGEFQDLVLEVAKGLVAAVRNPANEGGFGKHQGPDQYDENQESPAHSQLGRAIKCATQAARRFGLSWLQSLPPNSSRQFFVWVSSDSTAQRARVAKTGVAVEKLRFRPKWSKSG